MMNGTLSLSDRSYLREFLVARFNLSELRDLCFDLGINAETLPHATLTELARELVAYAGRREQLSCLLIEILRHRDDTQLATLLSTLPPCDPRRRVQIILPQDRIRNPQEVVAKLAAYLNLPPSEINLIATAPGSTRLLVSLPAEAAARLLLKPPSQIGRYDIQSITPFEFLLPTQQHQWREVARRGGSVPLNTPSVFLSHAEHTYPQTASPAPPVPSAPPMAAGWLTGWKLVLVALIVLLLVGIGVAALAAPRLTFENNCGRPIELVQEIPIVGTQIAPGRTTLPLWPGEYVVAYDEETITLQTPQTDFGAIRPGVPLAIELNGNALPTSDEPDAYPIGLGDEVVVRLCPF